MKEARSIVGNYHAWTRKGVVYARADEDTKLKIKSRNDLNKLKDIAKKTNFHTNHDQARMHSTTSNCSNVPKGASRALLSNSNGNTNTVAAYHAEADAPIHHSNIRGRGTAFYRGTGPNRGTNYSRGQYHRGRGKSYSNAVQIVDY